MQHTTPTSDPVVARLRDPDSRLTAAFVPSAGMIGISLADGGEELLGQRRGLAAYVEAGKTMGIPFLHPWANRLSGNTYTAAGTTVVLSPAAPGVRLDPNGLPIHGLLAAAPGWTTEPPLDPEAGELSEIVGLFDLAARPDLLASFPFPHEVAIAITLADSTLRVRTTIIPTSDVPVPLAFGFHPYLLLPGTPRETWRVELPDMRHRPVDARGLPTGEATAAPAEAFVLGERTFDDGYDTLRDGAAFAISGGGRRITVTFESGYPAAQIFAPAADPVICFEPMAAPTNALVSGDGLRFAEPGQPAESTFSIRVERDT